MKAFKRIARPNEDIMNGRLTMDVFAADLWQVVKGEAPLDYQDAAMFFRKTYMTKGLSNIIELAKKRLEGKGGNAVIQLQTPFGGGKTHTLIALYHKAKEWGVKTFVFVGTSFDPREVKPWEELERQLTGKVELTKGDIAPGKDKIVNILSKNTPVLILMDEVLEYITKASGIKVGDSNLGAQTLAFIQELCETVASIDKAFLVLTLPSSILEHYDENAERAFEKLLKITGRMEEIYAPVADEEIVHVIRKRLFENIDEQEVKKVVDEFIEHARKEGLLTNDELNGYRERFKNSYPFKPEVIDILYKRWGSFPTFQRTRGVLRLLSLVIHDSLNKDSPFIRLSDFNLSNDEIRRELIKHIGQEYDSVISQDIISPDSGSKKVDEDIGSAYKPYQLGTAVSTAIFMMSFSGKGEQGCSIKEVKLSVITPDFNSTIIDTTINKLREKLFYLSDDGLYFTNKPNLNRIIVNREENIRADEILQEERILIEKGISKTFLKPYLYPKFSRDVPDNQELKLVILNKEKPNIDILENSGDNPRVYRNTLVFLCIDENGKEELHSYLRKLLALRSIEKDAKLKLTEEQKKTIQNKIKELEEIQFQKLRNCYRRIYLPSKDGFKEKDMGISTNFGKLDLSKEVYDYLKSEGVILEKLAPLALVNKYLAGNTYADIRKIYDSLLSTPGEIMLASKDVLIECIKQGVKTGSFALGYLKGDKIECKYFKEEPVINLIENEIIVKPDLCEQKEISIEKPIEELAPSPLPPEREEEKEYFSSIQLELKVPVGGLSKVANILNFLQTKFSNYDIKVIISASNGKLDVKDFEDKIREALNQAKIQILKEEKN
ncbi:MAG: ATP-binding protein [Fervidicoccaceae archaeon]